MCLRVTRSAGEASWVRIVSRALERASYFPSLLSDPRQFDQRKYLLTADRYAELYPMNLNKAQLWERFQTHYRTFPELHLSIDISRIRFEEGFFDRMRPPFEKAFKEMSELEAGAIANPDEGRMVGHYWLRNSQLAPTEEIRKQIDSTVTKILTFTRQVHSGEIQGSSGKFTSLLIIGIGGSALGPQFVANALSRPQTDPLVIHFLDNTDPDGIDKVLSQIDSSLGSTLAIVISKSGGTKETRNAMVEAERVWKAAGLSFAKHSVAITGDGSELDKHAQSNGWLERFPMWDWVGGRTSELSAVGLLPAALQGFDIQALLKGAASCDTVTRKADLRENPAALLAATWFHAGQGAGTKAMVVLPYKDRLELISRYLQQLVMESLGKELNLKGEKVNQGLTVYGNKGSTDQHAYIQQLRDGPNNFFALFIEVLIDRDTVGSPVEGDATTGDYLLGFLLGTRTALFDNERESITLTIDRVDAHSIGVLIALFERAVGLYASLIGVNAYHQPGVEAGKKAASSVLALQTLVLDAVKEQASGTASDVANRIHRAEESETVFKLLEHLAANGRVTRLDAGGPFEAKYSAK